jgi:superfamily II DNA/RNA helicase
MQEKPLHEVCASLAEDRGPTIVFCPEVAVARAYEGLMNERYRPGRSKMLYAESPDEEREEAGQRLAHGDLDYIFNVNLYTEGYDLPNLLRVVWAAPTASLVRYTQGVGRVFRTHHSLREHLVGGIENAESRRLLIEQSPKPFGLVVTYYPQNCEHELCDPIDILGGEELPESVKKYAKQIQEDTAQQAGGSSTAEDIETSRVFCDLFSVLDEEAKEIKARAEFDDIEFDPMSGRRQVAASTKTAAVDREAATVLAAEMWPRGELASEKQAKWLRWKGASEEAIRTCSKWRASVVRDLHDLGCPVTVALGYGKAQALKVLNEMRQRQGVAG